MQEREEIEKLDDTWATINFVFFFNLERTIERGRERNEEIKRGW